MNTTHTMNANVTISLAEQSNPTAPAITIPAAATPVARRKTLVLGMLAVASCAAFLLVFKAVLAIKDVVACLEAAYKSSSL